METNPNQEFDFLTEKNKQRPINKRKLLRRTVITASMAVIFGMISCLTFLLFEPIISNKLYPEEKPIVIEFPEETIEEEILPEDMIADDAQMQLENTEAQAYLEEEQIAKVLNEILKDKKLNTEDYITMYDSMFTTAKEVEKSVVTVTGVTAEVDWFNNAYESKGLISGVIIADNGKELLILVNINSIKNADSMKVTFYGGEQHTAVIKRVDRNTGLAIVAVLKEKMEVATLREVKVITPGSSSSMALPGSPIIVVGRTVGNAESICYGFVTSSGTSLNLSDATYKLITTDIYGSNNATGVLVNVWGQMIGMVDNNFNNVDTKNMVSAIGISELKKFNEQMSNNVERAYLGIHGMDVSAEAYENSGVPYGAYITEIDLDSPAMSAGIQSGDIIVKIGEDDITSFSNYVYKLLTLRPEQILTIRIMRQGPSGYTAMNVEVTLGHSE